MRKRTPLNTVEAWRDASDRMYKRHNQELNQMHEVQFGIAFPHIELLRKATPKDIVDNAVIYYPHKPEPYWQIIDQVLYPADVFKAYVARDGCRYGLDGAYVKIK